MLAACGFHLWNAARDITRKLMPSASSIGRTGHFFAKLNNTAFATAESVPFDERNATSAHLFPRVQTWIWDPNMFTDSNILIYI